MAGNDAIEVAAHANQPENTKRRAKMRQAKILLVFLAVLVIAVVVALIVVLLNPRDDDDDDVDRMTMLGERESVLVDCLPSLRRDPARMKDSKERCLGIGCEWKPQSHTGAPWCVYPRRHTGYVITEKPPQNTTGRQITVELNTTMTGQWSTNSNNNHPFSEIPGGGVFDHVSVRVEFQRHNRLRIRFYPTMPQEPRWEIPASMLDIEETNDVTANADTSLVNVTFWENPFGVIVRRKDSGTVVFDSCHPGTVLADQFLRLTTSLASGHLYGYGEHRHVRLRHDMNWTSWAIFTRDAGPNSNWNLYGHQPVHLNRELDGRFNMLMLKNSNAMEVLLQPEPYPAVTFTTTGGVLDFYLFVGDSPSDVISSYVKSIGSPPLPPYWALGYHLSRWGYRNITHMRCVVDRTIQAGIPYDGQWADIDTFYKKYPFTFDPDLWDGFPEFVTSLKKDHHLHFVTIVDPGVGTDNDVIAEIRSKTLPGFNTYDMYRSGLDKGIYVMNSTGDQPYFGEVWPGVTVYPDFSHPDSQEWWQEQIRHYLLDIGVEVDALWIDMNEPTSFVSNEDMGCANNTWNYPPWCPNILGSGESCRLFEKTVCMDARQSAGLHYNTHSLYAHTMAQATYRSLGHLSSYKNLRPWTMTRSSFVGTGQYATKWQGDNRATWEDMHYSIISIIEFGFFGFAMNGADICGFWLEPSFELCVRWHQLGAFYPFSRNHNGRGDEPNLFKDQDPASFGQDFVDLVKPVLLTRYKFLPYLYTCLYEATRLGLMVMQPLFYQFPQDSNSLSVDTQFMLGDAFLVSPVLIQGATSVRAYFPPGRWFDYLTGEELRSDGRYFDLATPLDKFNLHLRGGHVTPWQEPDVTTYASRTKGLGLTIALDHTGKASGHLFWDDGMSKLSSKRKNYNYNIVRFNMEQAGQLTIQTDAPVSIVGTTLRFRTIEIYGLDRLPTNVKVNSRDWSRDKVEVVNNGIIRLINLALPMTSESTVSWSLY